ncbi:hypothetical protein GC093_25340 [Paenibacillus sp. LMG 31456]|uniref:Uncharacterized protein n=1 Tax=Paenibacillus foliorum TaxID=2654974 RepID=A0A972K4Y9_9BACL|nr:hypothetical protein [Paenibacillus foliorum]NOU96517.1 hypothetical protein [Paenibacillus foliorum]
MLLPVQKHVFEQEFALSRQKVWELLSNTDHLNRVIGLFPIRTQSFRFQTTDFIQELTAKVAGVVPMRWQEHPFQWVRNERYDVVREYRGGPLKRFFGGIELRDAETVLPDGSRATIVMLFAEFTPANAAGILAIPIVGISSMRNTMKYLHSSVKLAKQEKEYLLPQPKANYIVNQVELERLFYDLGQGFENTRMLSCFKEHLYTSGDDEVVDMRPYELAVRWGEIPAGSSKKISFPDVPEELRLRVLRANHTLYFQQENKEGLEEVLTPLLEQISDATDLVDENEKELHYDGSQWSLLAVQAPKPGSVLKLVNNSSAAIIAMLEKCDWKDAVTASKVTAMHEFRSMFSSEVLAPGQQVGSSILIIF